jgi:hypothetical protein
MNKHKQKKSPIIIGLITLQVLTIAWVASLQIASNIRDSGSEHNTRQLLNTTAELRFCIDNNINPCNDTSINDWNSKNPSNTFTKN